MDPPRSPGPGGTHTKPGCALCVSGGSGQEDAPEKHQEGTSRGNVKMGPEMWPKRASRGVVKELVKRGFVKKRVHIVTGTLDDFLDFLDSPLL